MTSTTSENSADSLDKDEEFAAAMAELEQSVIRFKQILADDRWPATVALIPASVARDLHRYTNEMYAVRDRIAAIMATDENGE